MPIDYQSIARCVGSEISVETKLSQDACFDMRRNSDVVANVFSSCTMGRFPLHFRDASQFYELLGVCFANQHFGALEFNA